MVTRISGTRSFGLTGVVSVLYGLSGCGGGGGGTAGTIAADTATGQFLDSAVQGLTYVSGSQSGVTDASGTFTYEIGQVVLFSIGGVTLGQTTGQAILSPMHLIPGANVTAPRVGNITRFLMMLDDDGDPGNGIHMSDAVRDAAQNWSAVDFTMGGMSMHLAGIVDEVGRMRGRTAILPDLAEAQAHLRETLSCAYSGGFTGDYTGDSSGTWMMVIDAQSGAVTGIGHSRTGAFDFELGGHPDIEDFRSVAFEMASGGSTMFQGTMAPSDSLAGTRQDASLVERALSVVAGAAWICPPVHQGPYTTVPSPAPTLACSAWQ